MAERKSSASGGATSSGEAAGVGNISTSRPAGDITARSSSVIGSANTTSSSTAMQSSSDPNRTGMVDRMKDRAAAQINSQKDRATDGLGTVAQAVRQSTQQLRDQHHETVASYVEQAADQIERLSQRLRQKDIGSLLGDAQQLARRQPALFIGSAFALGVICARILKSSPPAEQRYGAYGALAQAGQAVHQTLAATATGQVLRAATTIQRLNPSVSSPSPTASRPGGGPHFDESGIQLPYGEQVMADKARQPFARRLIRRAVARNRSAGA